MSRNLWAYPGIVIVIFSVCGSAVGQDEQRKPGSESSGSSDGSSSVVVEEPCMVTPAMIDQSLSPIAGEKLRRCIDRSAELDTFEFVPDPKLWVRFTVEPDGSFTGAELVAAEYRSSELERCVAAEVEKVRYPDDGCPGGRTVKYPFVIFYGYDALEKLGLPPEDPGPPPDIDIDNL